MAYLFEKVSNLLINLLDIHFNLCKLFIPIFANNIEIANIDQNY